NRSPSTSMIKASLASQSLAAVLAMALRAPPRSPEVGEDARETEGGFVGCVPAPALVAVSRVPQAGPNVAPAGLASPHPGHVTVSLPSFEGTAGSFGAARPEQKWTAPILAP